MMMEKAIRRLQDLPEEALSASDATRMIEAGDRLLEKGLDNWGNAIAVDEMLQRLSNGQ